MSIISDTDHLIHSIRLSYLKEVEDIYGPRIIAFDPSHTSNPYITHATLADNERWPELSMPQSPQISDDEADRPSGFPGAKLKYTQTIMGARSGGLGLRVSGKRASASRRMSKSNGNIPHVDVQHFVSGSAPVQEASSSSPVTNEIRAVKTADWPRVPETSSPLPVEGELSPQPEVKIEGPTAVDEAPVAKVVQFVPKFKGAAEMERRRRARMAARRGPGAAMVPPPQPQTLSFSSSDEEDPQPSSSDESPSDDFEDQGRGDTAGELDEFDPDFAATRTTMTSDASDDLSVLSGGTSSVTNSSAPISYSANTRLKPKLSPVSEAGHLASSRNNQHSVDQHFEMLTPAVSVDGQKPPEAGPMRHRTASGSSTNQPSTSAPSPASDTLFARKKVVPIKPQQSALSGMLNRGKSSNPFTEVYASVSGRSAPASTNVSIFFPHAKRPAGKAMELTVSRDATVEEVIGFALWMYWEEGWLPKLDEGLSGSDDPRWEDRISACGWILRLAEDDGEVDDDFPPPDRLGKIMKFNADAFAILEATPAQVKQNKEIEAKIQRPIKTPAKKQDKLAVPNQGPAAAGSGSLLTASWGASAPISTSLGPSSSHGPQIFLRIRVENADAVHISTTIPVSAGMYMQEALEMVCRRRKIANPKDYVLLLADKSILIPLDRTVASLQDKRELLLLKRSVLPTMGGNIYKGVGRTTDPNASIFKNPDTQEIQYTTPMDYTAAYKKYTIYRKMPMLVARQERTLAVDGEWVHIMPSSNKAKNVFDSGRTSSYHVKTIADCQQSSKSSATFKLVLTRGGGATKRYDFEAESPKLAAEIVQTVKNLKAAPERSNTVKSRRSRQVG